jgi:hypothetical protein
MRMDWLARFGCAGPCGGSAVAVAAHYPGISHGAWRPTAELKPSGSVRTLPVGLAHSGRRRGYRVILVVPDQHSRLADRRRAAWAPPPLDGVPDVGSNASPGWGSTGSASTSGRRGLPREHLR